MQGRLRRLWRARPGVASPSQRSYADRDSAAGVTAESVSSGGRDDLALPAPEPALPLLPEQPVLLMASGDRRPVHVGEVLPARRKSWPLSFVQLPAVPKRAILAAGVCTGLAAPGLARLLAMRLLTGRPVARPEGVLEITRIVYSGPLGAGAVSAIEKALTAGRR